MYRSWIHKYIRLLIFGFAMMVAIGVLFFYTSHELTTPLTLLRLSQSYAFCALIFLYCSMTIGPLYACIPKLPAKSLMVKARRALGVSSFGFACAHASFAFFGALKGFAGLPYLPLSYTIYLLIGLSALFILGLLAVSSFDYAQKLLGKCWFWLHRLVYGAGVLILIHAHALGSHFLDVSGAIPVTVYILTVILVAVELLRMSRYLAHKHTRFFNPKVLQIIVVIVVVVSALILSPARSNNPSSSSLSIHSGHTSSQNNTSLIANIDLPLRQQLGSLTQIYRALQDSPLNFRIQNLSSLQFVDSQDTDEQEHVFLFVISKDRSEYKLLSPQAGQNSTFVFEYDFAETKDYILYLHYQPKGESDQQFVFSKDHQSLPTAIPNTTPNTTPTAISPKITTNSSQPPELSVRGLKTVRDFNRGKTTISFSSSQSVDLRTFDLIIQDTANNFAHIYKPPSNQQNTQEFIPFATKKSFTSGQHTLYLCSKNADICYSYELNLESEF